MSLIQKQNQRAIQKDYTTPFIFTADIAVVNELHMNKRNLSECTSLSRYQKAIYR